jgi:hypothetical protein
MFARVGIVWIPIDPCLIELSFVVPHITSLFVEYDRIPAGRLFQMQQKSPMNT